MWFFQRIFWLCLLAAGLQAQPVQTDFHERPLNEALLDLKDRYDLQFSFNDKLLARCLVSDTGVYEDPEQAIETLLKPCRLAYRLNGSVFVIYPVKRSKRAKNRSPALHIFNGQIIDWSDGEPLPFATIQCLGTGMIADVHGNFSYRSPDTTVRIKISHIGYGLLDTVIVAGSMHQIGLTAAATGLREVLVLSDSVVHKTHLGNSPGLIKVNHKISTFLPGNRDQVIFNLLRLQPGILAAGEQTEDFMIWGSYKGQTLILFDGITLFHNSGYFGNIGVVNPLIVKDIEVMKGGYHVHMGDRLGGVVNISGRSGDPERFGANLTINNLTSSGYVNLPLTDRITVQGSFRKTYYNLYNWQEGILPFDRKKVETFPSDYSFADVNGKISGHNAKGDRYYFSFISSDDLSSSEYDKDDAGKDYFKSNRIHKLQKGGSFSYGKKWKNAGITRLTLAGSDLGSSYEDVLVYNDKLDTSGSVKQILLTENSIAELSGKADHRLPLLARHNLHLGVGFTTNASTFRVDSTHVVQKKSLVEAYRFHTYVRDDISISPGINFQPGLRLDWAANQAYIQPRVRALIKPSPQWSINLAWGKYHQFITENTLVDGFGNYIYHWNICDNVYVAVPQSYHHVAGITFSRQKLILSAEAFYKTSDQLTRFSIEDEKEILTIHKGESSNYGIDWYLRQTFGPHEVWVAYTLSRAMDRFRALNGDDFQRAPHDQRHEVKGAALFNFSPYYFSVNYVFGSGFPNTIEPAAKIIPYSRLDIAFSYKIRAKKLHLETGLSVLNVMNTENVRYNNFYNLPDRKTIYASAIPLTPALFLKLAF